MSDDLSPRDRAHALKVATEGCVVLNEQIRTLGLSASDEALYRKFRRDCDNLWADAVEKSSGGAKFIHAIRAYMTHINEDLKRLIENVY